MSLLCILYYIFCKLNLVFSYSSNYNFYILYSVVEIVILEKSGLSAVFLIHSYWNTVTLTHLHVVCLC